MAAPTPTIPISPILCAPMRLAHAHVEAARGEGGRAVHDVAVVERQFRVVPGALDGVADELSLGERAAEVGTGLGEGEDTAGAFDEEDRYALGDDARWGVVAEI